ncbi:PLAC8-domain-containing protein [Ephemerocybe angulata]|uniref:PLAC8-domain-containing protein n=1 Tax=Ephemerocybe angulata TaxID=980116 RepID=A0A8H6I5I4_9AGAR|nr:PLAC8-domain-containing protein [Tulosesus angulatus]
MSRPYTPQGMRTPSMPQPYIPQAPMSLRPEGGNRNAKDLPVKKNGRSWSNGLCGCCEAPGTCLLACCLPCMVYGDVKTRKDHLENHGTALPNQSYCSGDCALHGLATVFGLGCIFQMIQRTSIRKRYNISGNGCDDCCIACWCTSCELTQESMEVELEEQSLMGHPRH